MVILKVADSFWNKKLGQMASFYSYPLILTAYIGQQVTLSNDIGYIISTSIAGIETFARTCRYNDDPFSILLSGFDRKVDMKGWECIFHE